jgi:hypothetical protein
MRGIELDQYSRDARTWRDFTKVNYKASAVLFGTNNPVLYLPAATLGHHALEMYLKAALICEGFTVFDPKKVKRLNPSLGLKEIDCAWGHELTKLGRQLADKRTDFNLSARLSVPGCVAIEIPIMLSAALALFDPFFSELRYPQQPKKLEGVGDDEKLILDYLVQLLLAFSSNEPQSPKSPGSAPPSFALPSPKEKR